MGRFFNAEMPEYIQNTMYISPHRLIQQGLASKQKAYDTEIENLELFKDKANFNYLKGEEYHDRIAAQEIKRKYEGEADSIAEMLSSDGNSKEAHRRLKRLQRAFLQDKETGDISKLESSYNTAIRLDKQLAAKVKAGMDVTEAKAIRAQQLANLAGREKGSLDEVLGYEDVIATPELLQGDGKILDLAKKIAEDKYENFKETPNGEYIIGVGSSARRVTREKLINSVYPELMNSPDLKSYMSQQGRLGLQDFSTDAVTFDKAGNVTGFANNKIGRALQAAMGTAFKDVSSKRTVKNDSLANQRIKRQEEEGFSLSQSVEYNTRALSVEELEDRGNTMLQLLSKQRQGVDLSPEEEAALRDSSKSYRPFAKAKLEKLLAAGEEAGVIDKDRFPGGIEGLDEEERISLAMEIAALGFGGFTADEARDRAIGKITSRGPKGKGRGRQMSNEAAEHLAKRQTEKLRKALSKQIEGYNEKLIDSHTIKNTGLGIPAILEGEKPTLIQKMSRALADNLNFTSTAVDMYEGSVHPFDNKGNLRKQTTKLDKSWFGGDIDNIWDAAGVRTASEGVDKGLWRQTLSMKDNGYYVTHIEFTDRGKETLGLSSSAPESINLVSKAPNSHNAQHMYSEMVKMTRNEPNMRLMLNQTFPGRNTLESMVLEYDGIATLGEDMDRIETTNFSDNLKVDFGSKGGELTAKVTYKGQTLPEETITDVQKFVDQMYQLRLAE